MTLSTITGSVNHLATEEGHQGPFLAPTYSQYAFDASDSGPTDAGGSWSNDANAFDGSTATSATHGSGTGQLVGYGTTAPSGNTYEIVAVRVRFFYSGGSSKTCSLPPPSGGWTWTQLAGLGVSFQDNTASQVDVRFYDAATNQLGGAWVVAYNGTVEGAEVEVAYLTGNENNLYMVAEDSANADQICVFKSTNGGTSWSKVDQSNQIDLSTNGLSVWAADLLGFVLAVGGQSGTYASGMDTRRDYEVRPFDLTLDAWDNNFGNASWFDVGSPTIHPNNAAMVAMYYGTDYTPVAYFLCEGTAYTSMGSDYATIARYGFALYGSTNSSSGTLVSSVTLDLFAGGFTREPGVTPTIAHGHYGELGSGGVAKACTLTATSGINATTSTPVTWRTGWSSGGMTKPIVWDDSGTIRILLGVQNTSTTAVRRMVKSSGVIATDLTEASPNDNGTTGSTAIGLAWDPVNGDAYTFFGYSSDNDLYYSAGANGTSWGTDGQAEASITTNDIWTTYYKRNGTEVIGYIILNGIVLQYGELSLASGPQTYDETGKTVDIVSTTTLADAAVRDEQGLTFAGTATVTIVDGKVVNESLTVNAVVTVGETDAIIHVYDETGRTVDIVSTLTGTDAAVRSEAGLTASLVTTTTLADTAVRADSLTVAAAATVTVVDAAVRPEVGKTVDIVSTVTGTDVPIKDETGLVVAVTSTVTASDVAVRADTLTVPVVSTVTGVDGKVSSDSVTINLVTTTTVTDAAVRSDSLTFSIVSTVTGTDVPIKDETGLVVAAVSTVTATDTAVRADTGLTFSIVSTVTETDARIQSDSLTANLVVTVTPTDAAVRPENGLTFAIVSTVTGTDHPVTSENGLLVDIVSTTTATDQAVRGESLTSALVGTVTVSESAVRAESLTANLVVTVVVSDVYVPGGTLYDETGKVVAIVSTTTGSDTAVRADVLAVPVVSTTSLADAALRVEVGKTIDLTTVVSGSDAAVRVENGLAVVLGTLTVNDVGLFVETMVMGAVVTVGHTDVGLFTDSLTFGMDILVTETDIYVPSGYTPLPSAGFPGGREGRYDRLGGWPSKHRTMQRVG